MKLLAILRFIRHSTVLLGVGLVGGAVTVAGVVMLVTPGPGLVVIIAGLAILSTQFAWAERALDRMKQRAIAARDKASARRADRRAGPPASGPTTNEGPNGDQVTDIQAQDIQSKESPPPPGTRSSAAARAAEAWDTGSDTQATG